jgi:hypothetical protein
MFDNENVKIINEIKNKFAYSFLIVSFIFFLFLIVNASPPQMNRLPTACTDSDGDCNFVNMNSNDNSYESVNLKTYPYGWINATDWDQDIPSGNTIDNATLHVIWKTDTNKGANYIYIGYFNSTDWVDCAGPFSESAVEINTTCDLSGLSVSNMNNIKVRFRGEDTDALAPAFAYIDHIYIEVNYSAPPLWSNQMTNDTDNIILSNGTIKLSAQGYDDVALDFAILSTNESGSWVNYTDGTYGSPINMNDASETWVWSNFTWRNNSISGVVGWKIYYNDTYGKENVTNISTFFVQYRRLPTACTDSDGDCNFVNMNSNDNSYESVNLKTYPYGWINVTDWDQDIPSGNTIDNATLHVIWKTDTNKGANYIYIGYFNSTDWVDCAGPFSESAAEINTTCDLSGLSVSNMNNIKVRFRGEDTDSRQPAYAYINLIYIDLNHSIPVQPYLEVELILPDPSKTTYVTQNQTFIVNSTVTCKRGNCGNVNGTLRYNLTSSLPDTSMNTSEGEKPFYVQESPYPSNATKYCPNNPLNRDQSCNITWVVNATGDINTEWKLGVLFESDNAEIQKNHTGNATVDIAFCTEDISLAWNSIDFGLFNPSTNNNSAPSNDEELYNITNTGTCMLNLWIKGSDLQNSNYGSTISVGNLSWSNTTNDYTTSYDMTYYYSILNSSFSANQTLTTYYWLSVPPVYAGYYVGSVYICGNYTSTC